MKGMTIRPRGLPYGDIDDEIGRATTLKALREIADALNEEISWLRDEVRDLRILVGENDEEISGDLRCALREAAAHLDKHGLNGNVLRHFAKGWEENMTRTSVFLTELCTVAKKSPRKPSRSHRSV